MYALHRGVREFYLTVYGMIYKDVSQTMTARLVVVFNVTMQIQGFLHLAYVSSFHWSMCMCTVLLEGVVYGSFGCI